jgi:hypothetical protein
MCQESAQYIIINGSSQPRTHSQASQIFTIDNRDIILQVQLTDSTARQLRTAGAHGVKDPERIRNHLRDWREILMARKSCVFFSITVKKSKPSWKFQFPVVNVNRHTAPKWFSNRHCSSKFVMVNVHTDFSHTAASKNLDRLRLPSWDIQWKKV